VTENKYLVLIFLAVMVLVVHRVVNIPAVLTTKTESVPVTLCTHQCVMNAIQRSKKTLSPDTIGVFKDMCKVLEETATCEHSQWLNPGYHFKHGG